VLVVRRRRRAVFGIGRKNNLGLPATARARHRRRGREGRGGSTLARERADASRPLNDLGRPQFFDLGIYFLSWKRLAYLLFLDPLYRRCSLKRRSLYAAYVSLLPSLLRTRASSALALLTSTHDLSLPLPSPSLSLFLSKNGTLRLLRMLPSLYEHLLTFSSLLSLSLSLPVSLRASPPPSLLLSLAIHPSISPSSSLAQADHMHALSSIRTNHERRRKDDDPHQLPSQGHPVRSTHPSHPIFCDALRASLSSHPRFF